MFVVNHGGANTDLWGDEARCVAELKRIATFKIDGAFRLSLGGTSTPQLAYDVSADDMRTALIALDEITDVVVSTHSIDFDETGSGARRWDVTFTSLKEAGNVNELVADFSSITQGTVANVTVKEQRTGLSDYVHKIVIDKSSGNSSPASFKIGFNHKFGGVDAFLWTEMMSVGVVGDVMGDNIGRVHRFDPSQMEEDYGSGGVLVEKEVVDADTDVYYVLMTDNNDNANVAELFSVEYDNANVGSSTHHASSTVVELGGVFQLGYGKDCFETYKGRQSEDRFDVTCVDGKTVDLNFDATAQEVEDALEALPAIVDCEVTRTHDLNDLQENKVLVESGIVGKNYNYFVQFRKVFLDMSNEKSEELYEKVLGADTLEDADAEDEIFAFASGDLPNLVVFGGELTGTPTTDHALLERHQIKCVEVVKGMSLNVGGVVPVEVTMNGQDFTAGGGVTSYLFLPINTVTGISPNHGPIAGNTEVIVYGENFKESSGLSCKFGENNSLDPSGGAKYIVPAVKYISSREIICLSPPSYWRDMIVEGGGGGGGLEVYVEVSNNGGGTLFSDFSSSLNEGKTNVFTYDKEIEIEDVVPRSGPTTGNFTVTVHGGPFPLEDSGDEVRCRFGEVTVRGVILDEGRIQCFGPAQQVGEYSVEVSVNDQDYTDSR